MRVEAVTQLDTMAAVTPAMARELAMSQKVGVRPIMRRVLDHDTDTQVRLDRHQHRPVQLCPGDLGVNRGAARRRSQYEQAKAAAGRPVDDCSGNWPVTVSA